MYYKLMSNIAQCDIQCVIVEIILFQRSFINNTIAIICTFIVPIHPDMLISKDFNDIFFDICATSYLRVVGRSPTADHASYVGRLTIFHGGCESSAGIPQ